MNQYLLVAVATAPALALCLFVYLKDHKEKEPFWLLLLLFAAGAFACLPAYYMEESAMGWLQDLNITSDLGYVFVKAFFCVALVEEFLKLYFLMLITHKSRHFNYFFDGIVYAVFVSLGFALVENLLYAFDYGMKTALLRAVTSIPGHASFGVLMGCWYSTWMVHNKAATLEAELGIAERIDYRDWFSPHTGKVGTLLFPVLAHGFYDFCCMGDYDFLNDLFFAFILVLFLYCFIRVMKESKFDALGENSAMRMVLKKYPELLETPEE